MADCLRKHLVVCRDLNHFLVRIKLFHQIAKASIKIAGTAAGIAKILFFVFLIIAAVAFVMNMASGGTKSI
ncbi:MAG: DUF1328 domain-containing protein [Fuerstia sp.]|nr:DUF1328 domain-containing protein [Fuerstiella sp.]